MRGSDGGVVDGRVTFKVDLPAAARALGGQCERAYGATREHSYPAGTCIAC